MAAGVCDSMLCKNLAVFKGEVAEKPGEVKEWCLACFVKKVGEVPLVNIKRIYRG